jgi:hypothetical protein
MWRRGAEPKPKSKPRVLWGRWRIAVWTLGAGIAWALPAAAQLTLTTISPPCRVLDTRVVSGPTGGQPLQGGHKYTFTVQGACGVPDGAAAVFLNATAVGPSGAGDIRFYPAAGTVPLVSTLNFLAATTIPNGAIVPLGATTPDLGVQVDVVATVHLVLDVAGYFTSESPLRYYPLDPCRSLDTRSPTGPTGGAPLTYGAQHAFTLQGTCGIPSGAQALMVTVAVVSPTVTGDLRVYPGTPAHPPLVSSLNFNAGEPAIANNVIMPLAATTPDLSVFADVGSTGGYHLLLDVVGYFE